MVYLQRVYLQRVSDIVYWGSREKKTKSEKKTGQKNALK
jgi:hypothetical protein